MLPRRRTYQIADVEQRFWSKVNKTEGCWEWMRSFDSAGYGHFGIRGKQYRAHRLSYEWANGPIPEGICVLHRCDNPKCVRPDHLFAGTLADNTRDMLNKGRQIKSQPKHHGELSVNHKLTEEQVQEIRRRYAAGDVTTYQLAEDYGVSNVNVSVILSRKGWRHLPLVEGEEGIAVTKHRNEHPRILTPEEVREIRRLYVPHQCGCWQLAKRFQCSAQLIHNVIRGKSYADVL